MHSCIPEDQVSYIYLIKIMEVNLPDKGVFRGLGRLETVKFANRKFFPNVRNIHQFNYTHEHPNQYKTSFQSFKLYEKKDYMYSKTKRSSNQSHIVLGTDRMGNLETQAKQHYRKHDLSVPPKPIRHAEQGIGINEYEQRTGEKITYSTTCNDNFGALRKANDKQNIKYSYTRSDRFNPITGEQKASTSFGFEDFVPQKDRSYRANNFTMIPSRGQKYDIISGRRLPPF